MIFTCSAQTLRIGQKEKKSCSQGSFFFISPMMVRTRETLGVRLFMWRKMNIDRKENKELEIRLPEIHQGRMKKGKMWVRDKKQQNRVSVSKIIIEKKIYISSNLNLSLVDLAFILFDNNNDLNEWFASKDII